MSEHPHPVDIHVGRRVRQRRNFLGLSQEKLGKALGLTFQQVQKYERGANRIGSSRLFEISQILDVDITYFFDGMAGDSASGVAEGSEPFEQDALSRRETLDLVRNYYRISDPNVRKKVLDLVKSLSLTKGDGTS